MKIFYKIGIVLLVNLFYFLSVKASDFEVDGIAYNIISNSEAEVTSRYGINSYAGSVVIPEMVNYQNSEYTVTKIGDNAFSWCSELTEVTLPNSLISIGERAFMICEALSKIDLPNSLTYIGPEAFYSTGLINIKIPENVSFLGDLIFQYCDYLESIEVDSNNQSYASKDEILYNKDFSLLICCPSALSKKNLTLPTSVVEIKEYAFSRCWDIESLTLPNSLIKIGNSAFISSGFKNVNIPNSVKEIGDMAFCYSYLETIEIPASVMEIGFGAFSSCKSLNSIKVDSQNPNFSSLNGILYDKDYTLLISCPATKTEVTVPESVKEIGNYAFTNCPLAEIVLPVSVTKIGDEAFYGCQLLSNVILSDSLQTIGEGAFNYCAFSNINIPESVREIGMGAFAYCYYLEKIVIPDYVEIIDMGTFQWCYSLKETVIGKSIKQIDTYAFSGCPALKQMTSLSTNPPVWDGYFFEFDFDFPNSVLYVPEESLDDYRVSTPWNYFGQIIGMDAGIDKIKDNETANFKVYDLKGEKILETKDQSQLRNLPKGIYIIVSGKEKYKISM
ncbi:MAG: leucine-rich repeat domain-containing protein [Muribaculaceae bacterium]|nr:leucine-rich repeat domain-containing protein [Muribaculaceae bacterium]